ncbi:MAG TPA: type II toxin-antitoxin system prevent-host-death family antitoxin [Spirochaetota bacterium]|nr:type II toxin-antitoxin system prevent-host-death family antitoxin [Spirochaetota bacterium]
MQAISYSEVRKNFKRYLDEVYNNHDPMIITRKNNENLIVISLEDYNSLTETQYLLSSENNRKHLIASLKQLRSNNGIEKGLIEE